jgi:hypothetical protein
MKVRLTSGERAGEEVEVQDDVGKAWLVSGHAEPAGEVAEVADVAETPEKPKRKRSTAADEPETR